MPGRTLGELAEYVGGRVVGDPNIAINSAATLGRAGKGDISFLANAKYEKQIERIAPSAESDSEESTEQ